MPAAAAALGALLCLAVAFPARLAALGRALAALPFLAFPYDRWTALAARLGLDPDDAARRLGLSAAILAALVGMAVLDARICLALPLASLPLLRLEQAWTARRETLERELPWTLDLVAVGVQAGLDFEVALDRASRTRQGRLAAAVQELLARVRMGVPRRQALLEWGEGSGVPAIRTLAGALVQADEVGSALGPALKAQSESVRTALLQRAEAEAQRAPVRMLFPLVLCFFPVTFLVIFGPLLASTGLW